LTAVFGEVFVTFCNNTGCG